MHLRMNVHVKKGDQKKRACGKLIRKALNE